MKSKIIKRIFAAFAAAALCIGMLTGCSPEQKNRKLPVQVLILPKFEVGEMEGDFPGEAQNFYEAYLSGGDVYEIGGCPDTNRLYYRDGIALFLAGQGKVASAINTSAVLSDERFDFSDAFILSVGCGGSAEGYGIFGDVFVISAAADFDLGHKADPREMESGSETTWFHDESFDETAAVFLDKDLTDRVYDLVKDTELETTEQTVRFLKSQYPGEAWADRPPRVMRGTSVTGDNFWKGRYDHLNAVLVAETYGCRDPYAITEMEDVAVAQTVRSFGLLDHLIILRVSVNLDVFPAGIGPEKLWGPENDDYLASEDSMESVDVFETGMKNCFVTGKVLIDAALEGKL